jgi:hypothetical protein
MKTYEILENKRPDGITDICIKATDENNQTVFIPTDPANSDYQAYLAQLEQSETPEDTL